MFLFKLLILIFIIFQSSVYAAFSFKGSILTELDKKPIEIGTVAIVELKIKTRIDEGSFNIDIPTEGEYTIIVSSPGYASYQKKVFIKQNQPISISLALATLKGASLTLRDQRDVQTLSRNTLTQKQLKEVPATFGDSLGALSTLPGIARAGSFFGPLIIRGINSRYNRYYIDDIPVLYPQHFGGLQSIISNELVSLIDLYSSAAPASFSQSLGGVIDMKTKDDVKYFGGVGTISLISADIFLEGGIPKAGQSNNYVPLNAQPTATSPANALPTNAVIDSKQNPSNPAITPPNVATVNSLKKEKIGYWIASARAGYLTLTISPILQYVLKNDNFQLPQYYDWQAKGKFFLDSKNYHSITLLYFGFYDTFKIYTKPKTEDEKKKAKENGEDPLTGNTQLNNNILSNNIGVYYTYTPSQRFNNNFMIINAINSSNFYANLDLSEYNLPNRTNDVAIQPNVSGIKNKLSWEWLKNYATFRAGIEVYIYYFKSKGVTNQLKVPPVRGGAPDFGKTDLFQEVPINFSAENYVIENYYDNSFRFYGIEFVPGIHLSYLSRTKELTTDPRFLLSYRTFWDMTLSSSIGWYSSFPQVNFFIFNQPFNQQPQVSTADYIKSEKSRHIVVGIEQQLPLGFSVKTEGFFNTYTRLLETDTQQGQGRLFRNSREVQVYGAELLLRFDAKIKDYNLYGWASYTYSDSISKSGLPLTVDPNGDKYFSSSFNQAHSVKLVAGFVFGKNTIGARFQLTSGFPYTDIVGAQKNNIANIERYSPIYGSPYTNTYPIAHSLDLRYSRTHTYKWGSVTWYIEVINSYYNRPENNLVWNYNKPYGADNPALKVNQASVIIPNFGVEIKF